MNKESVNRHLQNILTSTQFKQADVYSHILTFLVDAVLKGEQVKESILEVELFENYSLHTNYEGKVRVYMYHLRKKLEEYYRTDGKTDKLKFVIDKGQYNLRVEDAATGIKHKTTKPAIAVSIVIIIAVLILLLNKGEQYLWSDFFDSPYNTVIVNGNHYLLRSQTETGLTYSLHYDGIFDELSKDSILSQNKIDASRYSRPTAHFITKMGPVATAVLAHWFATHKREIEVEVESELATTEINKKNIIYLGPYKTLSNLRNLFLNHSDNFRLVGKFLTYRLSGDTIKDRIVENVRYDHVMVSYQKLSDNGNAILFFAGNHDIGVISTVKNFTDKAWLNHFYSTNNLNADDCFNALFLVKGIERTDLNCELVRLEIYNNIK
jgi:hypothetical protein